MSRLKSKRGMVLSLAIVILVTLLILGVSVVTMGTSNLDLALSQLNVEKSYQVAEAGLVYTYNDLAKNGLRDAEGKLVARKTYSLPDSLAVAEVELYENPTGSTPQPDGCPARLPQHYIYVVSTGQLKDGQRVLMEHKVGAMLCQGDGGMMSYGLACREFTMNQGILTAYDLKKRQEVVNYVLVAVTEKAAFQAGCDVRGGVLVSARTHGSGFSSTTGGKVQIAQSALSFPRRPRLELPLQTAKAAGTVLPPGRYAELEVSTPMKISGRYVFDKLRFTSQGRLELEAPDTAEVAVRGLSLNGSGSPFRHGGSSNHFRITYSGDESLELYLDKDSHVCLLAPQAEIRVKAEDQTLAALGARRIDLIMDAPSARFYVDPSAAQPSGRTAVDALIPGYLPVTVVGRQRF